MRRHVGCSLAWQLCLTSILAKVDASTSKVSLFAVYNARSQLSKPALKRILDKDEYTPVLGSSCFAIRGGAAAVSDDDSDDEQLQDFDIDEDDDDESLFGLEEDGAADLTERDFAEDTTVDRIRLAWDRTPPLTKAYISATFGTTLYGYMMNSNKFPEILTLDWSKILKQLQVWRLLTSFLNFGPLGIGWFMTAHFVWTYMATLERLCHNRPYDFWIMILFGQLSMVFGYPLVKMSPQFLGHNLSTFLVYIWARQHEGLQVSMFDLFTARAELLPWIFLAQTFLLEGELPFLDALGIAFGHLYYHLQTTGALKAPDALVRWYQESQGEVAVKLRKLYEPISSDFEIMQ
jgi:Derlin-2/3